MIFDFYIFLWLKICNFFSNFQCCFILLTFLGIINYGPGYEALRSRLDAVVNQVRVSDRTPLMSVLLSGPPGSGRTALAANLATSCTF